MKEFNILTKNFLTKEEMDTIWFAAFGVHRGDLIRHVNDDSIEMSASTVVRFN